MEDFINTAAMLLIPFGPFILVILVAIPVALIVLIVNIFIKLVKRVSAKIRK
jgi:hypothetical protein